MLPRENIPRLTPKEPITDIECFIDPENAGSFSEFGSIQSSGPELADMPVWHSATFLALPQVAGSMRREALKSPDTFGGDFSIQVVASEQDRLLHRILKMPQGTYYQRIREWVTEQLDAIERDRLHYFHFLGLDQLSLFWMIAEEEWAPSRAHPVRIRATFEGIKHCVQVRVPAKESWSMKEAARVDRWTKKHVRPETGPKVPKTRREPGSSRGPGRPRQPQPWDSMEVGQTLELPASGFTRIQSLRNTMVRHGAYLGMKFSVSALPDGGARITRVK